MEEILEEREHIEHTKKAKLVEDSKSRKFGREMAALGFTARGEDAVDSEEVCSNRAKHFSTSELFIF